MIVLSVIFFSDVKIVANLRKFGLQNYKKMEKYRVEEDKKIERQCKFFSLDIWFCEALLCYVFVIVENKKMHRTIGAPYTSHLLMEILCCFLLANSLARVNSYARVSAA